jgi:hypothetical protein
MRVLLGPGAGLPTGAALAAARALAGPGGAVVPLAEMGVGNFSRPLSAAEVALLRTALRAAPSDSDEDGHEIVGYVCGGLTLRPAASAGDPPTAVVEVHSDPQPTATAVVVVEDHVNLTWRSPLAGTNDDSAGPRFPSLTGVYVPDMAIGRLSAAEGMIVRSGVVAGVFDPERLNGFEAEAVAKHAYAAVSAELVPVVIVAAHLGLKVAAAIVAVRQ